MSKRLAFDDFADSQDAIREYIEDKEEDSCLHEARVIILTNGKIRFNDVIRVVASIETNYSFVELYGNEKFDKEFYSRYTNDYQKFSYSGGTLLIQAKDRCGNTIKINITAGGSGVLEGSDHRK